MCEKNIRTAVIGMGNMGSQYAALLAAGRSSWTPWSSPRPRSEEHTSELQSR